MTKRATTKDRREDRHTARRQHVHRFDNCAVCGAALACPCYTRGGRPRKYCSDAHRQEAYRASRPTKGNPEWTAEEIATARPAADVLGELVGERQWQALLHYGQERARALGLGEGDVPRLTAEYRREHAPVRDSDTPLQDAQERASARRDDY